MAEKVHSLENKHLSDKEMLKKVDWVGPIDIDNRPSTN